MSSKPVTKLAAVAVLALFAMVNVTHADGLNNNEVRFTGVVDTVIVNGEGAGTLFVTLDSVPLRVIVNPKTVILAAETILALDTLSALADSSDDLRVDVTGKFSAGGIVANKLEIIGSDAASTFHVRGHVTKIQNGQDGLLVSLLGINLLVDDQKTQVLRDGVPVTLAELRIGTRLEAEGEISEDGVWTAILIQLLSAAGKKGLVFFEGTVVSYDASKRELRIEVSGASGNVTLVLINAGTRIIGELAPGSQVLVIGTINPDLSFLAREIRVLAAMEIKPDERKLKIGETATFTVKLREVPSADVEVAVTVDPPGVVSVSSGSVTVPAGAQTVDFTVTALAAGTAVVTSLALGEEATALVKVGELSEDDTERPAADVRISFAPDHIKMKPNETREVVLQIKPPQREVMEVTFVSSDSELVPVPAGRTLSNGAAAMKVLIQAGNKTGTTTIRASLPAELANAAAELIVEVSSPKKVK